MYLLALGCCTSPIFWNRVIIACGGFFLAVVCLVKSKAGLFTCSWIFPAFLNRLRKAGKILFQSQRHPCSSGKCLKMCKLFPHFTIRPALLNLDKRLLSSWISESFFCRFPIYPKSLWMYFFPYLLRACPWICYQLCWLHVPFCALICGTG